jgi:S1-C subfamily serine protease
MIALLLLAIAANKPLPWFGMAFTRHVGSAHRVFLLVERVTRGGPAEQAGIRPGDLVTRFGQTGVGFGDDLDLLLYLSERKPGERIACDYVRNGKTMTTTMVIGKLPEGSRVTWEQSVALARQRRAAARAMP